MARLNRKPAPTGAGRSTKTVQNARRLWPYMLMAWERWQSLSPEQKERYKRQAQQYAKQGRKVLDQRRKGRR